MRDNWFTPNQISIIRLLYLWVECWFFHLHTIDGQICGLLVCWIEDSNCSRRKKEPLYVKILTKNKQIGIEMCMCIIKMCMIEVLYWSSTGLREIPQYAVFAVWQKGRYYITVTVTSLPGGRLGVHTHTCVSVGKMSRCASGVYIAVISYQPIHTCIWICSHLIYIQPVTKFSCVFVKICPKCNLVSLLLAYFC